MWSPRRSFIDLHEGAGLIEVEHRHCSRLRAGWTIQHYCHQNEWNPNKVILYSTLHRFTDLDKITEKVLNKALSGTSITVSAPHIQRISGLFKDSGFI